MQKSVGILLNNQQTNWFLSYIRLCSVSSWRAHNFWLIWEVASVLWNPYSQQILPGPCPVPDTSVTHYRCISFGQISVSSLYQLRDLPNGLFLSHKNSQTFLFSPICATCPTHLFIDKSCVFILKCLRLFHDPNMMTAVETPCHIKRLPGDYVLNTIRRLQSFGMWLLVVW